MATYSKQSDSQFVWTKYILLFGAMVVSASFVYLTVWSFFQTREWFGFLDFDGNQYVSLALAFVFQYGQGPVLYLRMKFMLRYKQMDQIIKNMGVNAERSSKYAEYVHDRDMAWWGAQGFGLVFIIFATVDGWTNIRQMWDGLDAKMAMGQIVGDDKYIFTTVIGVVMVFVEEGLGLTVSMAGNTLNDIRQVYGKARIAWLDMFGKMAEEGLSGRSSNNKPSYRPQSSYRPQQQTYNRPVAQKQSRPYNEPVYHPIGMSQETPPWEKEENG